MSDKNYGIKKAYVLYNGNVESVGNIIYLPDVYRKRTGANTDYIPL